MSKKNVLYIASGLSILVFAAFMRFYRLSELFYFMHDEETVAFRVLPTILTGKLFLIGGVTPFHVHLTPYFYYLSAFILALGKLDPISWGVFSGGIGVLTTGLTIVVGKKVFGTRVALISGLLYAGSYLGALFDRHYWPLSLDPLLSIITFYSLWQLSQKKFQYVYLLVAVFILGLSADLSNLIFPVVTVLVWWFWRIPLTIKAVKISLGCFLLSFLPLIFFDVRHDFSNISGIFLFFSERGSNLGWSLSRFSEILLFIPRALARIFYLFGNQEVAEQYTYCSLPSISRLEAVPWWMLLLLFICTGLIVWFWQIKKKIDQTGLQLILTFLGVGFAGMNIYGNIFASKVHDHYFATLFPVAFLMGGYLLARLWGFSFWGKLIVTTGLGCFLIVNVSSLLQAQNDFGYAFKKEAVKYALTEIGDNDFSLDSLGSCYKYGGWRYLFFLAGKEPTKSYVDQNYFWLYQKAPAQEHPNYIVVMVSPLSSETTEFHDGYKRYLAGTIKRKRFGKIEVLVVDNHTHQYDGRF